MKIESMSRRRWPAVLIVVLAATAWTARVRGDDWSAPSLGEQLFLSHCASCHDHPQDRVPSTAQLRQRPPDIILQSLRSGSMRLQGQGLNVYQMQLIASHLTGIEPGEPHAQAAETNPCPAGSAALHMHAPAWNGFSAEQSNARSIRRAGFSAAQVPRLKVRWAYAFRGSYSYGQPTVIGGRVFVTSSTGRAYSLDARTGCTHWTYDGETASRNAISVVREPGTKRYLAIYGDDAAWVYALDAADGTLRWKVHADVHPAARITGAPLVHANRVYVPVSSLEEVSSIDPKYPCCTFSGKVVALDLKSGERVWTTAMAPPAQPLAPAPNGTLQWGPAGMAIWSPPTLDLKRKRLYVTTGNSYTGVDMPTSDAVVALNLEDGKMLWSRQVQPGDNYTVGCPRNNCPAAPGPDYDFGSPVILQAKAGGGQVLLASQKSGVVYALDPDQEGQILWQRRIGHGSPLGGTEWGSASNAHAIFVPISDSLTPPAEAQPGLTALDIRSGALLWHVDAPAPKCSWGAENCPPGFQQALTLMPGIVFSGSLDGHLRAFAIADGTLRWDFDTARPYDAVNHLAAEGGSLDLGGPVIAGGMLYVNSGYGRLIGHPGNVLLAFSVDGK